MQKSNKNEIFMARVKNSNCLKFCTQVDPRKTRKTVYFFPQIFFFGEKRIFLLSPSRIDGSGHNRLKIALFRYKKMLVKKTSFFTMCHDSEFHQITYVNCRRNDL